MEASFVHLAAPPILTDASSHHATHEGFLETVRHASALLRAGKTRQSILLSGSECSHSHSYRSKCAI